MGSVIRSSLHVLGGIPSTGPSIKICLESEASKISPYIAGEDQGKDGSGGGSMFPLVTSSLTLLVCPSP